MALGALGAGLTIKAGFDYFGAKGQASAAEKAAIRAEELGREGSGIIERGTTEAKRDVRQGAEQGQQFLEAGGQALGAQKDEVSSIFAQERDVGAGALDKLQRLLGGGPGAMQAELEQDAGYQFRLGEGNKSIERAARASGGFGGGSNLKDFARFSQGLASSESQNIVNRLMGLAGIGSAAGRAEAGLGTGLTQSIAANRGSQANLAASTGTNLGGLTQQGSFGQANALIGAGTQANNFQMQAANANAAGLRGIGDAIGTGALAYYGKNG